MKHQIIYNTSPWYARCINYHFIFGTQASNINYMTNFNQQFRRHELVFPTKHCSTPQLKINNIQDHYAIQRETPPQAIIINGTSSNQIPF